MKFNGIKSYLKKFKLCHMETTKKKTIMAKENQE
ncbi:hypothetical protein BN1002_02033 [Bacillus sp. B-jedd]|nr:hypothetical protein BN1002_02033 [Bacillus sp. B-jedd]